MLNSKLHNRIERSGQLHVLQFWNDLSVKEQAKFAEQLESIDWESFGCGSNFAESSPTDVASLFSKTLPPKHVVRLPNSPLDYQKLEVARQIGAKVLGEGKVAAILLAGGQGTRLGFPHPKGMFPIGPISGNSLFEILAAKIAALSAEYGCSIPYLIMTSDGTHEETQAFFHRHSFFGLNSEDVYFFQQGFSPAIDLKTRKLLLADKNSLSLTPDGHGGLISALLKAGLFETLQQRGVEYLYSHQIDNPLANVCDPTLIGLHVTQNAEVSTKVVAKTSPDEKVGVAVDLNGKTQIVEYIDLPKDLANSLDENGLLKFWAGSTAIHLFNRSFLEQIAKSNANLPWHHAIKKIPHVDHTGNHVNPVLENGIKFERFIFDTLPLANVALIVETDRDEEFAPLKNKDGDFSAEYVKGKMVAAARRMLEESGIRVPTGIRLEVDPRFANSSEQIRLRKSELESLSFSGDFYLAPVFTAVTGNPVDVSPSANIAAKPSTNLSLFDPIVFESYYRSQIWGGRKLGIDFGRTLPSDGPFGEAWEISQQSLHTSRIAEGPNRGRSIADLWKEHREELAGDCKHSSFPLLVKWLECKELLSLQVHPNDEMAQRILKEPFGKSEAWVVIAAEPSATVYAGLKPGITRQVFNDHLRHGNLVDCLHTFTPHPGDCISLPAGTVHAAGGGILFAEVQQSSDATFRLFDWNRLDLNGKPRTLHIEQAIEAINWSQGPVDPVRPIELPEISSGIRREQLVDDNGFRLERYVIAQPMMTPHEREMTIWMVLKGSVDLTNSQTGYQRQFTTGSTILIPAISRGTIWKPKSGTTVTLLGVRLNSTGTQQ